MKFDIGRLRLRPATFSDAKVLFEWRNDPETRSASHNQEKFSFDSHVGWLKKSLKEKNRIIYIAEIDKIPVGTVRTDLDESVYKLSWMVNPKYRGQGIGKRMVVLLAKQISNPICAEIKSGNLASSRIAEACGMILKSKRNNILYYFRGGKKLD